MNDLNTDGATKRSEYRPTLVRLTPDIDGPLRAYAAEAKRHNADVIRQAVREFLQRREVTKQEVA